MIVKQHLIFILYSLCASVFKGERWMLLYRRAWCAERWWLLLSVKIICDHVTCEFK